MGDTEIIGAILGLGVIAVVLYFGVGLFASFYNFEDFEGDLDIDADSMEDLSEEIEDTGEIIFENFDTEAISVAGGSIAIVIGLIAGIVIIAYVLTK